MRARDVEIGRTYWVLVPARLPATRYPDRARPGSREWSWWWLTGCRFRLTVTAVDAAGVPPTVEGVRMTDSPLAEVRLTGEQAAGLGLPEGRYTLRGNLTDDQERPITLPELCHYNVPARWLRPTDGPAPKTHMDLDTLNRWGL